LNAGGSLAAEVPDGPWAQAMHLAFRFLYFAVCALAVAWAFSNVQRVPPDSRAVVLLFGNVVRQQNAGLLVAWPMPFERVILLPAADRQIALKIGETGSGSAPQSSALAEYAISSNARENAAFLLTGDSGIVHVQATLFYQISNPRAFVAAADHVTPALQRLFNTSAVAVCASRPLDAILVADPANGAAGVTDTRAEREQFRSDLVRAVNRRLRDLETKNAGLGVVVSRVDVVAALPIGAKQAFDRILTVGQTVDQNVANARTYAATAEQQANQDRDRVLAQAHASAEESLSEARTRTASVTALAQQSLGLSGAALIDRIYYDRIGALLRKVKQVSTFDASNGTRLFLQGPAP
jgi:regulator of protease activity HflC (stomatin/prohibitin superfamily)